MTQAIRGHLFEKGGQTFLCFSDFIHPSQVIGPLKSKVLSTSGSIWLGGGDSWISAFISPALVPN